MGMLGAGVARERLVELEDEFWDAVGVGARETADPERRLLFATVRRAVSDVLWPSRCLDFSLKERSKARRSALRWAFSDSDGPMSFRWCCDWLWDDPEGVIKIIRKAMLQGATKDSTTFRHRVNR